MIQINITGPRGGQVREEDKLEEFILHSHDILGLDKFDIFLDVIVHNQFLDEFKDAVGLCYPCENLPHHPMEIVVELARKDMYGVSVDILETLAHEMIHVRQAAKGEYMYENPARKHESFLLDLVMERSTWQPYLDKLSVFS